MYITEQLLNNNINKLCSICDEPSKHLCDTCRNHFCSEDCYIKFHKGNVKECYFEFCYLDVIKLKGKEKQAFIVSKSLIYDLIKNYGNNKSTVDDKDKMVDHTVDDKDKMVVDSFKKLNKRKFIEIPNEDIGHVDLKFNKTENFEDKLKKFKNEVANKKPSEKKKKKKKKKISKLKCQCGKNGASKVVCRNCTCKKNHTICTEECHCFKSGKCNNK